MERSVAAVLALAASTLVSPASADESAIHAQITNRIVRVLSVDEAESDPPFGAERFSETAVLISDEAHLVTNAGIARRTDSIVAILADGRRFAGTLVGSDSYSNLALYKIGGLEREAPPPANTGELRDGERAYAVVATSDGVRQTVSARILNARRVVRRQGSPTLPYIEIEDDKEEKPIRGPIFDERGALIGFVTLQTSPEQKTQVVLAIPIVDVTRIAYELRLRGKVRRSRIGVDIKTVTNDLAAARRLGEAMGALIDNVSKGSPADRAGLVAGDIILKVDSTLISAVIRTPNDYSIAMERIRAGSPIRVEVSGASGKRVVSLVTGEIVSGPQVGQPRAEERKIVPVD